MKVFVFLYIVFISYSLQAVDCLILVVTDTEMLEETIQISLKSHGHSATEYRVKGDINDVTVKADGKWLALSWVKDEKLIAESINVLQENSQNPRTLVVYNPGNVSEQASISCEK